MFINLLKHDLIKGIRKFYIQIGLTWIGMVIISIYFGNVYETYQNEMYYGDSGNYMGMIILMILIWVIAVLIMVTSISILMYTDSCFSTKTAYQTFLTPISTKKNMLSKIIVYFVLNFILLLGVSPMILRGVSYIDDILAQIGIFDILTIGAYGFSVITSVLFTVTLFIFIESILKSKFVNRDFRKNNKTLIKFITIIVITNVIGRVLGKLLESGSGYNFVQDDIFEIFRNSILITSGVQLVLAIIFFFGAANLFDKYKRVS